MFSVISYAFNAISPIILLILIGYLSRRIGLISESTAKQMNTFTFRFPFFAMMVMNLYEVDLSRILGLPWGVIGAAMASLVVLTLLGWLFAERITQDNRRKPVLIMALFRSNYAAIGLVLIDALAGKEHAALASVFQLPSVFYFNAVSVIILSIYESKTLAGSSHQDAILKRTLINIAKNPLILGLLTGTLILLIRTRIPIGADGIPVFTIRYQLPWLYTTMNYLYRIATPLALITLGARLVFSDAAAFRRELIAGTLLRLIGAPVIGFGMMLLCSRIFHLTLDTGSWAMMVAIYGTPMAVSSVLMSAQMHADDQLNAQLIVWTSILSMGTLFIISAILRAIGAL